MNLFLLASGSSLESRTSNPHVILQYSKLADDSYSGIKQNSGFTSSQISPRNYVRSSSVFMCEICHKHFPFKSYLIRHMYSHSGEKPISCPYCTQKFYLKGNLNAHIRRMHTTSEFV